MRAIFFFDTKNFYFDNSETYLKGMYEKVINYFSNDVLKVYQTFERVNDKNIEVFHFFFDNMNFYHRLKIYKNKQIEIFEKFFNNILVVLNKYDFDVRDIIQEKFDKYNYNSSKYSFILDKEKNICAILKNEVYYFCVINTNKLISATNKTYIDNNSLDTFLLDCYERGYTITKEI